MGSIIQLLKEKNVKKNYRDILIQYLNCLNNSNSKIDIVAKKIKNDFYKNMNDLVLNKNDELKYLILYFEEKYKKKLIKNYFIRWKKNFLGAKSNKNIKKIKNENNNSLYINNKLCNKFNKKERDIFSHEDKFDWNSKIQEQLLIEMKKYIIDYDEETDDNFYLKRKLINNKKNDKIIEDEKLYTEPNGRNIIENETFKSITDNNLLKDKYKRSNTDEEIKKYRNNFKEMEEEYRIKYLLSSKNDINDNDFNNIITIKQSINKAINNTRNHINKIEEHNSNKKSKEKINEYEKENINSIKYDSLEKIEQNENINDKNEDSLNKKYFINNDLKIEKINTKVINNFNIKLEALSQKGNRNSKDKLYLISNVNEFSFAPKSSSHNNDKNNTNLNKININMNDKKKSEKILSLKDLNESNKSDNNNYNNCKKILNNKTFDERLINEEMIQNFLRNKNNEGIFHDYKNKNKTCSSNKTINSYNYKNKYLGYTLGGIKRKKPVKPINNILISEHSLDININKLDEEIINKSNITSLKKDNSNFLTINKINSMLEEIFDEEKNKKIKIDISNTENNSFNLNYRNNTSKKNSNILKNDNIIKTLPNKNEIKLEKRNTISNYSNIFEYSKFNERNYIKKEENNKINKDEINNKKHKKFNVNLKGNDRKYILKRNIYLTGNQTSKNYSNYISKKNSFKLNIPLSNMSFNQRIEFFKNKKGSDIQKIKSSLTNKENNIYTFCPQTNNAIRNILKEKRSKSTTKIINYEKIKESSKSKINYDYLNELYLDYKKRNLRLKKLREENDKEDGISFTPYIYKNSRLNIS